MVFLAVILGHARSPGVRRFLLVVNEARASRRTTSVAACLCSFWFVMSVAFGEDGMIKYRLEMAKGPDIVMYAVN